MRARVVCLTFLPASWSQPPPARQQNQKMPLAPYATAAKAWKRTLGTSIPSPGRLSSGHSFWPYRSPVRPHTSRSPSSAWACSAGLGQPRA